MKVGLLGSNAHVLTNKNVVDKKNCLKDLYKNGSKNEAVILGSAAATGIAATLATTYSTKAAGLAENAGAAIKGKLKDILSENSCETLKNITKKVSNLPLAGKAGLAAAAVAAAIIAPISYLNTAQKAALIEKSYEVEA